MKKIRKIKGERATAIAELVREITKKSGKTQSELEEIFGLDRKSDGSGRHWRKLLCGAAPIKGTMILDAIEKGWAREEWGEALIYSLLESDQQHRRNTAAQKIEKHLRKIVQILVLEMPGDEADHLYKCALLGQRLAEIYVEGWRADCGGNYDDEAELENNVAEAEREAEWLLQFCSTKDEKGRLIVNNYT
ncbi:MAG: hypothetical protein ACYDIB_04995 [Desulfobulbia bacterium]